MEYLNCVLGIKVVYHDEAHRSMPNFIHSRYRIQKVTLDGKAALFVYPTEELDSVDAVKKHLERIQKVEGVPAVLILDHLTYRQKQYLLRDHIPFVVEGKQIYLPFMAVYLQERGDGERQEKTTMLPSAQLLLLYYIYHGCGKLLTSEACRDLGFTATSVSRASRQLEEMGLVQTEKRGVQKVLYSDKTPRALFASTKDTMENPIKRIIYVPKTEIRDKLLLGGYSALSEYTMMNPPIVECFATDSISVLEKAASRKLNNAEDQCEVQLWRFDPRKLTAGNSVDRLSLALALAKERDERVEDAVDEMLEQVWRDIDGQRNEHF